MTWQLEQGQNKIITDYYLELIGGVYAEFVTPLSNDESVKRITDKCCPDNKSVFCDAYAFAIPHSYASSRTTAR